MSQAIERTRLVGLTNEQIGVEHNVRLAHSPEKTPQVPPLQALRRHVVLESKPRLQSEHSIRLIEWHTQLHILAGRKAVAETPTSRGVNPFSIKPFPDTLANGHPGAG